MLKHPATCCPLQRAKDTYLMTNRLVNEANFARCLSIWQRRAFDAIVLWLMRDDLLAVGWRGMIQQSRI
jgi:hypothetical protein